MTSSKICLAMSIQADTTKELENNNSILQTYKILYSNFKLKGFVESKVCHVHKFANYMAHRLAKLAIMSNFPNYWYEEHPDLICDALLHD